MVTEAQQVDLEAIRAALEPLQAWKHQCHAASIHLVRSGVLSAPCRVARGSCTGVAGQHSWVVLGMDCYHENAAIVDPTLWSYDSEVDGVWVGGYGVGRHRPHGKGNIFAWGRPDPASDEPVVLTPQQPWSREARAFLDLLGPLDRRGWALLAHAPVEGWPAAEILGALYDDERLSALVPIDIVGMVTDRNPNGLYLSEAGR